RRSSSPFGMPCLRPRSRSRSLAARISSWRRTRTSAMRSRASFFRSVARRAKTAAALRARSALARTSLSVRTSFLVWISLTGMYLLRLFRQRDPFVAMDDFRPGDVRGPQGLFAGQPADAVHLAGGVPDDPASDDAAVFGGHFRDVAGAKIADDPDDAGGEQAFAPVHQRPF